MECFENEEPEYSNAKYAERRPNQFPESRNSTIISRIFNKFGQCPETHYPIENIF